ncbi:hypothetical protein [Streptomyces sp. NPDC059003]|uniref:hypothetical protein n=1 Tax=Streptomyces sp. NPDC059003 TaxID=3346691 RepID=UPI0036B3559D
MREVLPALRAAPYEQPHAVDARKQSFWSPTQHRPDGSTAPQAHCSGSVRLTEDASAAEVLKLTGVPADLLLKILDLVNAQTALEGRVMPRKIEPKRPELPAASQVIPAWAGTQTTAGRQSAPSAHPPTHGELRHAHHHPGRGRRGRPRLGERTGPLATLAAGTVPQCFGPLRIRLDELRTNALAASTMLGHSDEPDDPLKELGRQEMTAIFSGVAKLKAWVATRQCRAAVCECRADRLLRSLLEDQLIGVQSGYRPADRSRQRRPVALMAGYSTAAADGTRPPYVLVDFRNNIAHAVRDHCGWRARLITDGVATPVYTSPGYPETPVSHYYDDTQACAAAVAAALQ